MRRLSVPTWIGNAAAVLFGHWGDVTRQAETVGCSRQTVYQHAQRVPQAVVEQDGSGPTRQELLDENQALRRENRQLWNWLEHTIEFPKSQQRHFAVVAAAMGLSARQIAALLALILPGARGPGHATVRRWVHQEALKAGTLLKRLDRACKLLVTVACLDEIFFRRQPVLVAVEPQSMAWVLGQRTRRSEWTDLGGGVAGVARIGGRDRRWGDRAARRVGVGATTAAGRPPRPPGRGPGCVPHAAGCPAAVALDLEPSRGPVDQGRGRRSPRPAGQAPGTRCAESRRPGTPGLGTGRPRVPSRRGGPGRLAGDHTRRCRSSLPDGQLNERSAAETRIAQAIPRLTGADWSKVIRFLRDPRSVMFLERLHRQLRGAEPDETRRAELVRLWWLRRQRPRGRSASAGGAAAQVAHLVQMQVCAGLGADWVAAYRRVSRVLWSTVRASSAVECMNWSPIGKSAPFLIIWRAPPSLSFSCLDPPEAAQEPSSSLSPSASTRCCSGSPSWS